MAAIIHSQIPKGNYRILKNPSDPAGFDTASMEVLFRGTQAQLNAAFALGALNMPESEGAAMYCLGSLGATQARFGHIWATIGWKGFKDGEKAIVKSFTATSRDVDFPLQSGNVTVGLASPAGESTYVNGEFRRARATEIIAGLQQSGVSIGAPDKPPAPVKPTDTVPEWRTAFQSKINWNTMPGAMVNDLNGWVLRNFQVTSEFTAGAVCLRFWTAQWEWVQKFSP